MPKVSVVIPVYNTEKYLKQCVDSLINQTLKDIELIFVDDGSKDNSVNIINEYKEKDSRIRLLTQKNLYAGTARNNGMKTAIGEYIIFLDSDDFFDLDMLESMYNKAVSDNADVCICSAKKFDDSTGEITYLPSYLNTKLLPDSLPFSADDVRERIFGFTSPAPWNKLYKTDFVKANAIQFQPIKKTNDLFFTFSNLALAERITYVNKPFVNYRFGNSSSLQGQKSALSTEFYDALTGLKNELKKRGLFAEFEKSYVNRALSVSLYVLSRTSDKENYIKLASLLKNKYFFDFDVAGHTRGYFYNKSDFDAFLDIIEKSGEDLWHKYKETAPNTDYPLFDIDNWQNDTPFQSGGSVKISVIIPVYNTEKYVEECVNSVINNTLKDIEIICINDGSTDNSLAVLNSLKEKDSRITVIDKENGGLSDTRNRGIEIARGEYISFIDSDDYIHPKTYEYLYKTAKEKNLEQLYFSAKTFFDSENVFERFSHFDELYKRSADYSKVATGRQMFIKMSNNSEFRPSACMLISSRDFLNRFNLRFEKGLLHEDNLFIIQCLTYAKRVSYENVNLYFRRMRSDSISTGVNGIKRIYSYYKIIKILEQFAKSENLKNDKEFFEALKYRLSVIDFNACDIAETVDPKELDTFIDTLCEDEAVDFYSHINTVLNLRQSGKFNMKRAKTNEENIKVVQYKYAHLNDELKKKKISLENQKKSILSKRLVRLALKISAFISKLRGEK